MQESTYSTLSEPYFELLAKSLPSNEPFELQDIEAYTLFLERLQIQYNARLHDASNWNDMIVSTEKQIAELQSQFDEKRAEREQLEDQVAKQQGIAELAKQKFERPTELRLDTRTISVSLSKPVSQLRESYTLLEEEQTRLEEDLEETLEKFERRHNLVNEMADAIVRFRERFEDKNADSYSPREMSREPEERTPFPEEDGSFAGQNNDEQ